MLSWYLRRKKTKSQKEKQAKSWIKNGLYSSELYYIVVGHIPDALVEILFQLMKAWKIYSTKAIISETHRAAPEGKWVYGGGIKIPGNYERFGPKIHKKIIREKTKTQFVILLFFGSFFHLTQLLANGLLCEVDVLTIVLEQF